MLPLSEHTVADIAQRLRHIPFNCKRPIKAVA